MNASIKELEEKLLYTNEIDDKTIQLLKKDERKGVQKLLTRYETMKKKEHALEEMHIEMIQYESSLREKGFVHIAGLDEVGRGPLAGPVVAAAVILPADFKLLGLTDSKKLTKEKREHFFEVIKRDAICYSIQMVHAAEIDQINVYESTKLAMKRAVQDLKYQPEYLLLDAIKIDVPIEQLSLIKGDQKSLSIAASSVLAKVTRDRYMEEIAKEFPGYGFSNHVGYGTREHLHALSTLGITREHRKSFKPIEELVCQE
ncbi:ribonuclease HII [Alkalihalobacillus sp. MEB130]|uniref:ribonuclease HII n=1 Tax=Alkalihalobacillus sp. MEB130 TaxID=2976704 RepID=UPI0028DFD70A|nr:ribonuclease HII [Alkalihalobacillus sp. MEB130]MDT8859045.1 ribonuclease HII [Alkalihalobacillus sp. MEB130]